MRNLHLKPGDVYRTEDFCRYDKNACRFAAKLVEKGQLKRLRKGVFYAPKQTDFGDVPPAETDLLKSYFRGRPYLRTGPSVWNMLGLGTTGVEAVPLVYNKTRTGKVTLGGRAFELRRVRFPKTPSLEFFVVDLLQNLHRSGAALEVVKRALHSAVRNGRFDKDRLLEMASKYGTQSVNELVEDATGATKPMK